MAGYKAIKIAIATGVLSTLAAIYFSLKTPEEFIPPYKPAIIESKTSSDLENRLPAEPAASKKSENTGAVPPEDSKLENTETDSNADIVGFGDLTPGSFGPGVAQRLNPKEPKVTYDLHQQKIEEIVKNYQQGITTLDLISSKVKQWPEGIRISAYDRISQCIYSGELQRLQEELQNVSKKLLPFTTKNLENVVSSISSLPKFYGQANEVDKKYGLILQELQSLIKPAIEPLVNRAIELRKPVWHRNIQQELDLQEKHPQVKAMNMKNGVDIDHSYLESLFSPFKNAASPEDYEQIKNRISSELDQFFRDYGQGLKRSID